MDEQRFREGINEILPTLKLFVAGFNDGGQSFVDYMNNLDKEQVQKFYDDYSRYKNIEKINRVRKNILERLLKGSITLKEVHAILDEEKTHWEKDQLSLWTIPRIVYLFCYGEGKYYEKFIKKLLIDTMNETIGKAGFDMSKLTDPGSVTFDGANNFGKNGFYVSLGNNSHPDYTTQDQFRIESEGDNKLNVGIYHYKKGFIEGQYKKFDITKVTLQDIIDEAKECKDIVENDMYTGPAKTGSKKPLSTSSKTMTSVSLNTILYGVPGTGKTYNSIIYAVAAIQGKSLEEIKEMDYSSVKEQYEQYKAGGQIVFTTFHQSFGYEDFIEGIKAEVVNDSVKYDVKPGVFKKLCEKATKNLEDSKKSIEELSKEKSINEHLGEFLDEASNKKTQFTIQKGATFYIEKYNDEHIYIINPSNEKTSTLTLRIDELVGLLNSGNKITKGIDIRDFLENKWKRQEDSYLLALYNEFKSKYSHTKEDVVSSGVERKNYVMIIDEINRGNISKIFGELITLIEPKKRLGEKEGMTVKLPYSNNETPFGVPNNLYIIGTMNTSDRSIALIDLALRRRFKFKEIEPDSSLLADIPPIDGINIKELFELLNKRIEFLYDRDHLLGHSYFLDLKENPSLEKLNEIMADDIIPLLQEYFHDDWEKIQLVLGDGIIKSEMVSVKDLGIISSEFEDLPKYMINTNISAQDYPH